MISNKALISVIIPVYNGESTIARACDSVLAQSYPNVELVVVDDGSSDRTASIVEKIAGENSNVIYIRQENGGVSKARNTGLEASKGAYLMFLDADDELVAGCLERLVEIAEENHCDIVAGTCDRVRPDGSSFHQDMPMERPLTIWQGEEAFLASLRDHPATYAVWSKLYRAEAVADVRFVEGKRLHEDSFFLFEVLRRNVKMAVTEMTVVRYHLTQTSASRTKFSDKFLDMLYFAQRKYDIIQSEYPHLIPLGKNVLVKANMALLKTIWSAEGDQYRDVEKQSLRTVRENAAYFIPAIPVDRILFFAIRVRLFWLYKRLYKLLRH